MRRLHREKNITTPGSGKTGGACAGFRACDFLCSGKVFILFSRAFIFRTGLPFRPILQENGGGTADRLLSLVPFRSAGKRAGVRYSPAAIYSFPQTKAHVQRGGSISPSHLPHGSVLPADLRYPVVILHAGTHVFKRSILNRRHLTISRKGGIESAQDALRSEI